MYDEIILGDSTSHAGLSSARTPNTLLPMKKKKENYKKGIKLIQTVETSVFFSL